MAHADCVSYRRMFIRSGSLSLACLVSSLTASGRRHLM